MRAFLSAAAISALALCLSTHVGAQQAAAPAVPVAKAAVLDLQAFNPMPDDDITAVTKRLYAELKSSGRYELTERSAVEQAASGLGLTIDGCDKSDCAAQIGRALGVEKVIFGNVTKVEIIYELTLNVVNVSTGTIEKRYVEKVAGHMGDVAKVGVLCAVQGLHEEEKKSDYKKGDWKKVRGHGVGGRIALVMPTYDSTISDQIQVMPTIGLGIHYDAKFTLKNGAEVHYTPSFEYWMQEGDKTAFMRFEEFAFNVADFRLFFGAPVDKAVVFYMGLGPSFILDAIYQPHAGDQYPQVDSVYEVNPRFGVNVMAGVNHMMKKSGWMLDIGVKAKFWGPSVFELVVGVTRPFKGRGAGKAEAKEEAPATGESEPADDAGGADSSELLDL